MRERPESDNTHLWMAQMVVIMSTKLIQTVTDMVLMSQARITEGTQSMTNSDERKVNKTWTLRMARLY